MSAKKFLRVMRLAVVCALALASIPILVSPRTTLVATTEGGVTKLGRLPLPVGTDPAAQPVLLQVDSQKRRILSIVKSTVTNSPHLLEYTLNTTVPSITRDLDLTSKFVTPFPSPFANVVDTTRDRLLILNSPTNFVNGAPMPNGARIDVLDMKSGRLAGTWNFDLIIPGGIAWGMTYSARDDVVYVVGENSPLYNEQNGFLFPAATKPPIPAVIMALNPETGSLIWQLPLPQCMPLNTWSLGVMIARSAHRNALYVPCTRSLAYPNMAGVQRVLLSNKPKTTSQADALNFKQEFFPISGVWTNDGQTLGVAAFDEKTDRIAVQSLSLATPGAWVFDGDISGWVGFIATPQPDDAIGINQGNGHYYAGSTDRPTLISSVRGTPVQQGATFDDARVGVPGTFVFTDANTNRFFLLVPITPRSNYMSYVAFADTTADPNPLPPADYDSLTQNVPESADTSATFAGGIRGFGSRISMVGGFGGVWAGFSEMLGGTQLPSWPITGVSPGDRAVTLANVPSIDFRNAGASSSAQAVTPDTNSEEEVRTHKKQVESACLELQRNLSDNGASKAADLVAAQCANHVFADHTDPANPQSSPGQLHAVCAQAVAALPESASNVATEFDAFCKIASVNGALEKLAGPVTWPWPALACLDAGGSKIAQDASGPAGQGSASISCDLNSQKTHAESVSPSVSFNVGSTSVKIASSSVVSDSTRTQSLGLTSSITATTHGLEIKVPGSGSVSIAKVTSHAVSLAHGRSGTATVTLERWLEYLVLRDKNDKVIRSVPSCGIDDRSCQTALDQANNLIAPRFRLYSPGPEVRQTPLGAFAGVEKADNEYLNALNTENDSTRVLPALQAIFYNDTAEKSRLVVQMAGIETTSIYYVTKNPPSPPQTVTVTKNVDVPVQVLVAGEPPSPQVITRIVHRRGSGGLVGALAGTFAVLSRSVGQTITLAAIWLMFAAAVAAVVRRGLRR